MKELAKYTLKELEFMVTLHRLRMDDLYRLQVDLSSKISERTVKDIKRNPVEYKELVDRYMLVLDYTIDRELSEPCYDDFEEDDYDYDCHHEDDLYEPENVRILKESSQSQKVTLNSDLDSSSVKLKSVFEK